MPSEESAKSCFAENRPSICTPSYYQRMCNYYILESAAATTKKDRYRPSESTIYRSTYTYPDSIILQRLSSDKMSFHVIGCGRKRHDDQSSRVTSSLSTIRGVHRNHRNALSSQIVLSRWPVHRT